MQQQQKDLMMMFMNQINSRRYAIDADVVDLHNAAANLKLGVLTIRRRAISTGSLYFCLSLNQSGLTYLSFAFS
jgi:hypothetical protein